jgi:hypothetical protein
MTSKRAHYLLMALTGAVFMVTGHSQHVDVYVLVLLIAGWLIAISRPRGWRLRQMGQSVLSKAPSLARRHRQ